MSVLMVFCCVTVAVWALALWSKSVLMIKVFCWVSVVSTTLTIASCVLLVKDSLEWDHKNKCAAKLQPVDKKPCRPQT